MSEAALAHYENLIGWLANIVAERNPEGRLAGIPALLNYAEKALPAVEFKLLDDLVGF